MSLRLNARRAVVRLCRFIAEHGMPQGINHEAVLPITNTDSPVAALYSLAVSCEGMGVHTLEDRIETVELLNMVGEVETPDATHAGHVTREVLTLSSRIKAIESLSRAQEELLSDDPSKVRSVISRIRTVPDMVSAGEVKENNYLKLDSNSSSEYISGILNGARRKKDIETGTIADTWMTLGEGEMGVILAKSSVGKTTLLVDIGAGYVTGTDGVVIHFSEEMEQEKIMAKYIRRIGNTSKMPGTIIVESHASGTQTVNSLFSRVVELMAPMPNKKLIAVIIDYIGILNTPKGMSRYDSINESCITFRARCSKKEFCCRGWTAVQPQRIKMNPKALIPTAMKDMELPILGMDDISECIAVSYTSDYILSLNQSKEERECVPPRVRVHAAKVREPDEDAPSAVTMDSSVDYAKSRFI